MKQQISYFVSHIIKPKEAFLLDGSVVNGLLIQIISSTISERKSICWIQNGKKTFFNCEDLKDAIRVVKMILSGYRKFKVDILSFDKPYEGELFMLIIKNFMAGVTNLQEKIDMFNLNKELE